MEDRLVSVVIPTYQSAQYVGEAVGSVLAQTYRNIEIIVVDDGSTDNTREILASFGNRIRTIFQENQGAAGARNAGIQASRAEWIAFLDADDVWLPDKLEKQAPWMNEAGVGLIFCDSYYWDGNKVQTPTLFSLYPPAQGKIFEWLFVQNFISSSTALIRKECFERLGMFDKGLSEDYDMWLRISRSYEARYEPHPLAKYRMIATQTSRNTEKMLLSTLQVREKILTADPRLLEKIDQKNQNRCFYNLYLKIAKVYIQNGQVDKAREYLETYAHVRGKTPLYVCFYGATMFPRIITRPLFQMFDRIHYKFELGQY